MKARVSDWREKWERTKVGRKPRGGEEGELGMAHLGLVEELDRNSDGAHCVSRLSVKVGNAGGG